MKLLIRDQNSGKSLTREKAIDFFKQKKEFYKVEIIKDLPDDEELSIYFQGEWLDLCRGPHLLQQSILENHLN